MAEKILSDRKKLKAVCVWLELKTFYYNGQLVQARQHAEEIAHTLGISTRNYRTQIGRLKNLGLLRFDEQGTMYLSSWQSFFSVYGINRPGRFHFYRLKNDLARDCENLLRVFAIKENFKKQEHKIESNSFEKNLKYKQQFPILQQLDQVNRANIPSEDKERISRDLYRQIEVIGNADFSQQYTLRTKAKKQGLLTQWLREYERAFYRDRLKFNHIHEVNFDVTISCERVARLYNLKSKASGHYWEKKLAAFGFMKIERRAVLLDKENSSVMRLIWTMKEDGLLLHQFVGPKGIWKRLNNVFHFSNLALV